MREKGQGALEYLLLIGGAIVVAVIVVTLLLGIGTSGQGQTAATGASSLCGQKAAVTNQLCDTNTGGGTRIVYVDKCYTCGGTYANCIATSNSIAQQACTSD